MELKTLLGELAANAQINDAVPHEACSAITDIIHRLPNEDRLGSLLSTHVSAGVMMLPLPSMYLKNTPEDEIVQYAAIRAKEAGKKPPSARSVWYEACKSFMSLSAQAVQDGLRRRIPFGVRDGNLDSGKADVLDLPLVIAREAVGLLDVEGAPEEKMAAADVAVLLMLVTVDLLGLEIQKEWPSTGSAYGRFAAGYVGATVLDLLGVNVGDHTPEQLVTKLRDKNVKAYKKSATVELT